MNVGCSVFAHDLLRRVRLLHLPDGANRGDDGVVARDDPSVKKLVRQGLVLTQVHPIAIGNTHKLKRDRLSFPLIQLGYGLCLVVSLYSMGESVQLVLADS